MYGADQPWNLAKPGGAHEVIRVIRVGVANLPLPHERAHVIGEFIHDEHVIEDVALVVGGLASADGDGFERRLVLEGPGHFIHAVAGLLHVTIAREPGEVVPVAHLPLQVAHAGGAIAGRRASV